MEPDGQLGREGNYEGIKFEQAPFDIGALWKQSQWWCPEIDQWFPCEKQERRPYYGIKEGKFLSLKRLYRE